MTPFAVQQVWHAGRPVPVTEKGSTLALLLEATVQRITAAAIVAHRLSLLPLLDPDPAHRGSAIRHRRGRPQRCRRVSDPVAGLLRPLCP